MDGHDVNRKFVVYIEIEIIEEINIELALKAKQLQ